MEGRPIKGFVIKKMDFKPIYKTGLLIGFWAVFAVLWPHAESPLRLAQNGISAPTGELLITDRPTSEDGDENGGNSGEVAPTQTAPTTLDQPDPMRTLESKSSLSVRKPSLPSVDQINRSDGPIGDQDQNSNGLFWLGLMGIPMLAFSMLFVVLWGIISGRIQRLMF